MNQRKAELEYRILKAQAKFEREIRVLIENPNFQARFPRTDLLRLINLETWAERYHVRYRDLLGYLLHIWRGKFATKKSNKGRLGISVSTLSGNRSRELVEEWIELNFPNRENEGAEKSEQRLKMAVRLEKSPDATDPLKFASDYKKFIAQVRSTTDRRTKEKRIRRYRGNPFF